MKMNVAQQSVAGLRTDLLKSGNPKIKDALKPSEVDLKKDLGDADPFDSKFRDWLKESGAEAGDTFNWEGLTLIILEISRDVNGDVVSISTKGA